MLVRLDGLTAARAKLAGEAALRSEVQAAEAMSWKHRADWSSGFLLAGSEAALSRMALELVRAGHAEIASPIQKLLAAAKRPSPSCRLMGILNVTPDSFSDGGRYADPGAAVARGLEMVSQGAAIVDVGGESTRPGAHPVEEAEEIRRTLPVVERLRAELPSAVEISIDTMKAGVARAAAGAGATILNDVSGLSADPGMRAVAAAAGARVVISHMRGTPATMQRKPAYAHVVLEVIAELSELVEAAREEGVLAERIILDPGFGFGKLPAHNAALLRHLASFVSLGYPVLAGLSRKSFLGALAGPRDEGPASPGRADVTLAAETLAAASGAALLRTHDPGRAAHAVRLAAVVTSTQEDPRDDSVDHRTDAQPV